MIRRSHKHQAPVFDSDRPVGDSDNDQFSRAPFAYGVARSIVALPSNECFVIGIHGPWGDGKTTVLNFVAEALQKERSIISAWYNPWRYSNEEVMLASFFSTLAAAVRMDLRTRKERLASQLVKYGKYVATADERVGRVIDLASKRSEPPLEVLRERLREGLATLTTRIVVFVDDIDRLDCDETAALLRLIKACADFPNVVYVLAFDRDMVASVVGQRLAGGDSDAGRAFLEKIIQIPLMMPPASSADLSRACQQGVNEVLQHFGQALSDKDVLRWHWTFQESIARQLRTPRNVSQYLNAVRFAFSMLANEVNAVDLLLIEATRVFYPAAYGLIRSQQGDFVGEPFREASASTTQEDLLTAVKSELGSRVADSLDYLVKDLFPRYRVTRHRAVLREGTPADWTRDKRICSPAYGPRYFSYVVGSSDVADKDVDALIATAETGPRPELRSQMESLVAPLKQAMLIEKLNDRVSSLSPGASCRIATTIATLSDVFEEPFSLQQRYQVGIAASRLAVRLCEREEALPARLMAAQELIEEASEMWFVAAFMQEVDPRHPDPERPSFLDAELNVELRKRFVNRLERFLIQGPRLLDLERRWKFEMLFVWALAAGREPVHTRLVTQMPGDGNIAIRLLQCLAQPLSRSGEIVPAPGDLELADLDRLNLLVDVHAMANIVFNGFLPERLHKEPDAWAHLKPEDRILSQFWYRYHEWKKRSAQSDPRAELIDAPDAPES